MKHNLTINPPQCCWPKKKAVSQNGQTPNIIGICSHCVLDRPVFEWNQILLHLELTSGLSSLPMVPATRNLTALPTPRAWRSSPRLRSGLSILVIARPNSSQICSMRLQSRDLAGCSILVTLPWRRKSRSNRAYGVWCYRLCSGSYPRNTAWQMALRWFPKYPCRAHWWGSTRGNLAPPWKVPQTCTEPPPALTLYAWHLCWKCSPGNRRTLILPYTGCSWNLHSSLKMTCCQWVIVRFYQLCAHSKWSWQSTGASLWVLRHGNPGTTADCW